MAINVDGILEYLSETFGIDGSEVDAETALFSEGYLDSFSIVEVVVYLESEAGISFNPSEVNLDNLDSVDRMMSFIEAKTT